jgi:hypothetical protein
LKALSIKPPSHPWFPYEVEQSTNCCSEKLNKFFPLNKKLAPSNEPVVEKAQHEPHCPWFLIGVTAPAVTQLTDVGKALICSSVGSKTLADWDELPFKQLIYSENSWVFKSAN